MVETQEVTGFLPDVLSYNDYYPYGMLLPKRHASDESYRYGFQGQEKDDELKGEGNSLNYKYRMHDPRIGRFFAVDPLAHKYPHYTPYQFSGNRVIDAIELEGLEPALMINLGLKAFIKSSPDISNRDIEGMKDVLMQAEAIIRKHQVRKRNKWEKFFKYFRKIGRIVRHMPTVDPRFYAVLKYDTYKNYTDDSPAVRWGWIGDRSSERKKEALEYLLEQGYTVLDADGEIEQFTNDPSTLGDAYLQKVIERIESGTALGTDWLYASEAYRRKACLQAEDILDIDLSRTIEFIQGTGINAKKISVQLPEGYKEVSSSGKGKVYSDGKNFISPDLDGHNGGTWKKADKESKLWKKETREGTFNEDLTEKVGG